MNEKKERDRSSVWEKIGYNFARIIHYIFYGYFAVRKLITIIKDLFSKGE